MSKTMFYDFGDGQMVAAREHKNGGGIIALTAKVDDSVHVGRNCQVSGYAKILGKVQIVGRVSIHGDLHADDVSVLIEDDVLITGNVDIRGIVLIRDRAEIRGNVKLSDAVQVMHRARITENSILSGEVCVMENAYIKGDSKIHSEGRQMIIRGDFYGDSYCADFKNSEATSRKRRVNSRRPVVLER